MKNIKEEVKGIDSNFDIEKLPEEKRKLLKQRHKYEKQKNEIKRPTSAKDEALKKSMMIIGKSSDARRIIEEVMERAKLSEKEKEESVSDLKQMNGYVYKKISENRFLITWPFSQRESLYARDQESNNNDLAIESLINLYGVPY